ncbi:MAG: fibrobacter succinogenes major paralogous domain-containing protein, partial [Chitinispirillaceae bacterium]|nr:fibrobacter succinogenes major paralogous domain-containing protein [Chitinispirillaceae bacterium]
MYIEKQSLFIGVIFLFFSIIKINAENINISGIVKNSEGKIIPRALVKLKKIDLSTLSGIDGTFTLNNGARRVKTFVNKAICPAFTIKRNFLFVYFPQKSYLTLELYTLNGKRITIKKYKLDGERIRIIELPLSTKELYLLKIEINNKNYLFTIVNNEYGMSITEKNTKKFSHNKNDFSALLTEGDLLEVKKDGYINFCMEIKNFDTSGIEIIMVENAGDIIDIDGNIYQSIQIGNQIWSVENLKVTRFNDGTPIKYIADSAEWCNIYLTSSQIPAYCIYGDSVAKNAKYGLFYNWYAVGTGKLAPKGWR